MKRQHAEGTRAEAEVGMKLAAAQRSIDELQVLLARVFSCAARVRREPKLPL